jgi:putative ABC transport system permease protein
LTAFSPKNLLNTAFRSGAGAGLLRRTLVVVQFTASIALIACTAIFFQQLQFIQNKKLGYEPVRGSLIC